MEWQAGPLRRHLWSCIYRSSHLFCSTCHHVLGWCCRNFKSVSMAGNTHLQMPGVFENVKNNFIISLSDLLAYIAVALFRVALRLFSSLAFSMYFSLYFKIVNSRRSPWCLNRQNKLRFANHNPKNKLLTFKTAISPFLSDIRTFYCRKIVEVATNL